MIDYLVALALALVGIALIAAVAFAFAFAGFATGLAGWFLAGCAFATLLTAPARARRRR